MASETANRILALIGERNLRVGDSIPPTGEMVELFGVSRPVIREAIAELAGRGLVNRGQGREGTVTAPGAAEVASLLNSRTALMDVSYAQLQDFRELVETGAARLAARDCDTLDIARLSDVISMMRAARTDEEMLRVDLLFHQAVADIASPLLGPMLEGLGPLLAEARTQVWHVYIHGGGDVQQAIDRHVAIRDAIASRDSDAAAAAMRADLADTRQWSERRGPGSAAVLG